MLRQHFLFFSNLVALVFHHSAFSHADTCSAVNGPFCSPVSNRYTDVNKRYLIYDVNPGEGFNLRRDVYMRVASLVKSLNDSSSPEEWILVLPPWGPLYHWKSKSLGYQIQIKWSKFFDISSLNKYVTVMEFEDFFNDYGPQIDVIYYLQHYVEGWTDDRWEEKIDLRSCIDPSPYLKTEEGVYTGWFWDFEDVYSKEFYCISVQGYSSTLKKFLKPLSAKVIMIDRAEVMLHDSFGDAEYWKVRKSMEFSKKLIAIGDAFRKNYLNSTDTKDKTERKDGSISKQRLAIGGPYIAVHLRRRDFTVSRPKDVPSIKQAAKQILKHMERLNLNTAFIATDAPDSEFLELQEYIPSAIRFSPSADVHNDILDGGVAIVDQWICAHARFFIGSYESTFSFRIQEEREILGFPVETTFNRLCGDNQSTCQQPSKWTIVHK